MRKIIIALFSILLVGLFAFSVYSQEETPTVEVTDEPTAEVTPDETAELTPTVEDTPGETSAPSPTATPEATEEIAPEATVIPLDRQAHYRIAHFSVDLSAVHVQLGTTDIDALEFPEISEWHTVEAGDYQLTLTTAGETASSFGSFEVSLEAGNWSTIALIGSAENLTAYELEEDYRELNPGTGGLTIFDAIESDLMVNFNRNGVPYVVELTFPNAVQGGVSELTIHDDTGAFDFQVVETQDPANIIADLPQLNIEENAYTFIAVVGTEVDPQVVIDVTHRAEVNIELGTLEEPGTILEALQADENLTTLAQFLETAGLAETLRGEGPYTVFAPANFVLDTLDTSNPEALANLLLHHVVEGKVMSRGVTSAQTLQTLAGDSVTVRIEGNNIFIDDAQIITLNIPATNGVIHMINNVLSPELDQ